MLALCGNLSIDVVDGGAPRIGGGAYHGARALRELGCEACIVTRCAGSDRDVLLPQLAVLGIPVTALDGESTACFAIDYDGDARTMRVDAIGPEWSPDDAHALGDATAVHIAPLARSDFSAETVAAFARGRRLSFDAQGLVRPARTGPLELEPELDPDLLAHVSILKVAEEEAAALGDPAAFGVPEVVLTKGSLGATVFCDGDAHEVPAYPLPADPTGAGDMFAVAYLASRDSGLAPAAAARRATAVVAALL